MAHNIHGTFVSEKINKIRWRPSFMNDCHFFITGSWDNDENHIKLWDFQENEEDAEIYPYLIAESNCEGDITEIKFLDSDLFVISSTTGSVSLQKIHASEITEPVFQNNITWEKIHKFPNGEPSPCTSFAVYDHDIASVGEDGCINLMNADHEHIFRKYEKADSCSLHNVIFLKHNEILTSNLRGQMKIWDVRTQNVNPSSTFMLSGDPISSTCLQHHPTQMHLVVAGDEEGSITIWDLRQNTYPVNVLDAHEGSVSEIQFHPDYPDHLFSCSTSGDVWHWSPKGNQNMQMASMWLAADAVKSKLDVFTLMPKLHKPINSLDLNRNKVICGCDNEAVYLINGVNLFK